jgi:hypothetical protein
VRRLRADLGRVARRAREARAAAARPELVPLRRDHARGVRAWVLHYAVVFRLILRRLHRPTAQCQCCGGESASSENVPVVYSSRINLRPPPHTPTHAHCAHARTHQARTHAHVQRARTQVSPRRAHAHGLVCSLDAHARSGDVIAAWRCSRARAPASGCATSTRDSCAAEAATGSGLGRHAPGLAMRPRRRALMRRLAAAVCGSRPCRST